MGAGLASGGASGVGVSEGEGDEAATTTCGMSVLISAASTGVAEAFTVGCSVRMTFGPSGAFFVRSASSCLLSGDTSSGLIRRFCVVDASWRSRLRSAFIAVDAGDLDLPHAIATTAVDAKVREMSLRTLRLLGGGPRAPRAWLPIGENGTPRAMC